MKKDHSRSAFTRVELLAAVAATALMAIASMGAMSGEHARRVGCHNNLRQLGMALHAFATEHDGRLPERRFGNDAWKTRLLVYVPKPSILRCPADERPLTPHSYLYNGWADLRPIFSLSTNAVAEWEIPEPKTTIAMGEKRSDSLHLYMDFDFFDDINEIEPARHSRSGRLSGASNYLFADGSVGLLKFPATFEPINLWAVTPEYRYSLVFP